MLAKIGLVIVGTALAMSAMGRVENVVAHRGFCGSVASAQESNDPADDASSQDMDDAPQDVDAAPDVTAQQIQGTYSGTIDDAKLGSGTYLGGFIPQIRSHSKLLGTWVDSLNNVPGSIKGSVNSSGAISATYKLGIKGRCIFKFHGMFNNGEISGTYTTNGCTGPLSHGTLDIIRQ
ncbi:MAG TPA: hypothetical protein VIW95_07980 [Candidatus Binatus sp.]|uniref:hypothetical protein n=1 Tax=Candidatus Binatus sp. TaxID=2811406 RepID=UPI002F40BB2C